MNQRPTDPKTAAWATAALQATLERVRAMVVLECLRVSREYLGIIDRLKR